MIILVLILILCSIALFYLIGAYAVEKEHKDNWKGARSMEIRKSQRLSEAWTKRHPILDWFQGFYYACRRIKDKPANFYRECKWFIQRGKNGYSDRDVWGFHYYLNRVIVEGIKQLQKNKAGCPCMVDEGDIPTGEDGHWTDEGSDIANKKWEEILNKIVWTFEKELNFDEHSLIPVYDEKERKDKQDFVDRMNAPDEDPLFPEIPQREYRTMTVEEMKKYHEGWELFKKYFQCLWD